MNARKYCLQNITGQLQILNHGNFGNIQNRCDRPAKANPTTERGLSMNYNSQRGNQMTTASLGEERK